MTEIEKRLVNNIEMEFQEVQEYIRNEIGCTESISLDCLNSICLKLTRICKDVHEFMCVEQQKLSRNAIDMVFLSLRQLICCINNLEKITTINGQEKTNFKICKQHFQERMIFCLMRLKDIVQNHDCHTQNPIMNETNYVVYMDQAIGLLSPLSMQLSYAVNKENDSNVEVSETKFIESSRKVRDVIELLIGQTLAFITIVGESDKKALNVLCHLVMKECIELQEMCLGFDNNDKEVNCSENDKRLQAQQLLNALYNLDRSMNDSFLRIFFQIFSESTNNPMQYFRAMERGSNISQKELIEHFTEKFDDILDRLIQIGIFSISYTSSSRAKSHLQSCLATFEALSTTLVPSMLSECFQKDCEYLEKHWNETINQFRHSVDEIINTQAFCITLIDLMYEVLAELTETNFNKNALKTILAQCSVLQEHIIVNAKELRLNEDSKMKLYFDDLKMMINECNACINSNNDIDSKRIRKRFNILLSVIKNISKMATSNMEKNETNDNEPNKPFTFGNVTMPADNNIAMKSKNDSNHVKPLTESMDVIIDLNEFIAKNDTVRNELTHRSEIFYRSRHATKQLPKFAMVVTPDMKSTLKKDLRNSKRVSKRTSLRVAMFKRQKLLDTQRFLNDITPRSNNEMPVDSLNLQITDILDHLTANTSNVSQ